MTDELDLTILDDDGNEVDATLLINGDRVGGGDGDSNWTLNADGALEPAGDEPVSVGELNNIVFADRFDTVEAAVNEAAGGTVFVPPGTYQENLEIRQENTTLIGPKSAVVKTPDDATPGGDDAAIRVLADNVTVRGLSIDGNRQNNPNLDSKDDARYADGIAIYADGTTVDDCLIEDCHGHGIIAWNEAFDDIPAGPRSDISISNNSIHRSKWRAGIDVASTGAADLCHDVTIDDNTIVGESDGTDDQNGVTVHTGRDITITGNTVRHVVRGFNVHSDSESVVVNGNVGKSIRERGINVRNDVRDTKITDNTVEVLAGEVADPKGVYLEDIVNVDVVSNTIIGPNNDDTNQNAHGIRVNGTSNIISRGVKVSDNRIRNLGADPPGISIVGDSTNWFEDADVFDNVVIGGPVGIVCQRVDGISIRGNTCRDQDNYAIRIFDSTHPTVESNTVKNTGSGIRFDTARTRVNNNRIMELGGDGIEIDGTLNRTEVRHNRFDDITGDDILGSGGTGSDISGNFNS